MKILAFVDLHNSHKGMRRIKRLSRKADIILCAGDLTIFENDFDKLLLKLSKLKKPVLIIPGNHESDADLRMLCKRFDNVTDIHEKSRIIGDHLFLGYGGGGFSTVDKHFTKVGKKFEKKMKKHDGKMVLMTHAPPYRTKIDKIMDEHCGNKSIRNFIVKAKLDIVISGHLHENTGKEDKIGKTRLYNPGPFGRIITV